MYFPYMSIIVPPKDLSARGNISKKLKHDSITISCRDSFTEVCVHAAQADADLSGYLICKLLF